MILGTCRSSIINDRMFHEMQQEQHPIYVYSITLLVSPGTPRERPCVREGEMDLQEAVFGDGPLLQLHFRLRHAFRSLWAWVLYVEYDNEALVTLQELGLGGFFSLLHANSAKNSRRD